MNDAAQQIDYRPHRLRKLWRTTIGKKYVVAITGVILALFIVAHVLGNLKAIQGTGDGQPPVDHYAEWLRDVGDPVIPHEGALWATRAILLIALLLHIAAISQLWARNRAARPPGTPKPRRQRGSLAARYMTFTGLLILAFVVFHILHFTTRTIQPEPVIEGTVYLNMHQAFQLWWLTAIYVGVTLLLGLHLWHGLWSGAQTAGVDNPDRNWFWRRLASGITLAVVVGFAIVPVLFWAGALPDPATTSAQVR